MRDGPEFTEDNSCALLTSRQVRKLLGNCSEMQIWRYLNSETHRRLQFPAPIKIGARNFWRARDIARWIDTQAAKDPVKGKRPGESSGEAA